MVANGAFPYYGHSPGKSKHQSDFKCFAPPAYGESSRNAYSNTRFSLMRWHHPTCRGARRRGEGGPIKNAAKARVPNLLAFNTSPLPPPRLKVVVQDVEVEVEVRALLEGLGGHLQAATDARSMRA